MKRRFILKSAALMIALLTAIITFSAPAAAQSRAFTITPVATAGDRIEGGGRFLKGRGSFAYVAGPRALNNRGEVVVIGHVSGPCTYGAYLVAGGRISPLADYHCNLSPMGPFIGLNTASINENAQVLLGGRLNLGDHSAEALFISADGKLSKVIAEGDSMPIDTTFSRLLTIPFPSPPTINSQGQVAFFATTRDAGGNEKNGIFVYDDGGIHKIIEDGDAFPMGGSINIDPIYAQSPRVNDRGELLFYGFTLDRPDQSYSEGYFLATPDGVVKVIETHDDLPNGRRMMGFYGTADLNNRGEVVILANGFGIGAANGTGIYVYANGQLRQYVYSEDVTPIGGKFVFDPAKGWIGPRINDRGIVAFDALVSGGTASRGIFLASATAVVKVVAVGDVLPSGQTVRSTYRFAFNDRGQIAFVADGKKNSIGAFLVTPVAPKIKTIQLKRVAGALELRIGGAALITNDTIIEINGVTLAALDYPATYREDGGTTTRVVSHDPRLGELLLPGRAAEVTVYNPLTNQRSNPVGFTP